MGYRISQKYVHWFVVVLKAVHCALLSFLFTYLSRLLTGTWQCVNLIIVPLGVQFCDRYVEFLYWKMLENIIIIYRVAPILLRRDLPLWVVLKQPCRMRENQTFLNFHITGNVTTTNQSAIFECLFFMWQTARMCHAGLPKLDLTTA